MDDIANGCRIVRLEKDKRIAICWNTQQYEKHLPATVNATAMASKNLWWESVMPTIWHLSSCSLCASLSCEPLLIGIRCVVASLLCMMFFWFLFAFFAPSPAHSKATPTQFPLNLTLTIQRRNISLNSDAVSHFISPHPNCSLPLSLSCLPSRRLFHHAEEHTLSVVNTLYSCYQDVYILSVSNNGPFAATESHRSKMVSQPN